MFGPGEYRPDPSEGITTPAELPSTELIRYYRSATRHPCPRCGHSAYRDKQHHRTLGIIPQRYKTGHENFVDPFTYGLLSTKCLPVDFPSFSNSPLFSIIEVA